MNHRFIGFAAAFAIALGLQGAAHAQTIAAVDAVVEDELIKQNIVGGAVAVVRNGAIVHAKGYGHTSLMRETEITQNTRFRWASISKTLTAVAALQVDEAGDFDIGDKVIAHVDYWPWRGGRSSITIRQLLSHRGGIVHYRTKDNCPDNKTPNYRRNRHSDGTFDAEDAVRVFQGQKLCFRPGTSYKYSTFGFSLVAASMEEATGVSYAAWVRDNIKNPLGMTSLRQATGVSKGYDQKCGALVTASEGSKGWVLPGGGWESDITDLARFANAILTGSLLSNTSRLWTEPTGNTNNYRLGIRSLNGGAQVRHGGTHDDTKTELLLYPGRPDGLGVVVYLNGRHGNASRMARRVARALGATQLSAGSRARVANCEDGCAGEFSAVWRKTGDDVILRKGIVDRAFAVEWRHLRKNGYYLDDFEAYKEGGELRWDGVFRKGPGQNAMWRNFSRDAFADKWREMRRAGFHLVDVETYEVDGERRWAGLFRPGVRRNALFRYLSNDAFGDKQRELSAQGLKLIDIEAFRDGGSLKWAGVWIEGPGVRLNRNFSRQSFGELRAQREGAGWKLIDIERYRRNNAERWAGVWERSSQAERINRNYQYCGKKDKDDDWKREGISNRHNDWRADGFELIDWERD